MDQQSVESLLRRLVERVEESERRYSEALDDLHARLDQLSQTTGAARAGSSEDAETFGRLHDQVSSLARRLEGEASTPLDDFERLGRALAGDFDRAVGLAGAPSAPDLLDDLAAGRTPFAPSLPEPDYSAPFASSHLTEHDLDRRTRVHRDRPAGIGLAERHRRRGSNRTGGRKQGEKSDRERRPGPRHARS
jgi:hypothetical protein